MKPTGKFLIAFGIIFILLFIVEFNQQEPVDWSPGFGKAEKKPFGNFLLFEMLPEIFKNQNIEVAKYNIIDQLDDEQMQKQNKWNYIFINDKVEFNEFESDRLIRFAEDGNAVFIASNEFADTLLSSLALKQKNIFASDNYYTEDKYSDSLFHFNFCNNIKSIDTGYSISNDYNSVNYYFDSVQDNKKMLAADTFHHCILTEVAVGKGKIILCSLPYAFSNYYMLKPANLDFILKTLTRLPVQGVLWDEHYKAGKDKESPMRYLLSKKSLKWAYYLALAGLFLFVVFMGRRKQRIIPTLDPMKNTSLEFAETVGQVYYEKGDHLNLALKKIKFFTEYIRSKYYQNVSQEINRNREEFLENLSNKCGKSPEELKALFNYISYIESANQINEKELIYLNTLIEKFKIQLIKT